MSFFEDNSNAGLPEMNQDTILTSKEFIELLQENPQAYPRMSSSPVNNSTELCQKNILLEWTWSQCAAHFGFEPSGSFEKISMPKCKLGSNMKLKLSERIADFVSTRGTLTGANAGRITFFINEVLA